LIDCNLKTKITVVEGRIFCGYSYVGEKCKSVWIFCINVREVGSAKSEMDYGVVEWWNIRVVEWWIHLFEPVGLFKYGAIASAAKQSAYFKW